VLLADSASYQIIQAALMLAFEAGKWEGQVELEEHYDRNQFAEAFLEAAYARKNAMPLKDASTGRTVTVNLRSKKVCENIQESVLIGLWGLSSSISANGWVFAKLPLQILQIKHKC